MGPAGEACPRALQRPARRQRMALEGAADVERLQFPRPPAGLIVFLLSPKSRLKHPIKTFPYNEEHGPGGEPSGTPLAVSIRRPDGSPMDQTTGSASRDGFETLALSLSSANHRVIALCPEPCG